MNRSLANTTIKRPKVRRTLHKKEYRTQHIIDLVNDVYRSDRNDVEHFARYFPPTRAGLKALFDFMDSSFRYKEDPAHNQWVQTPSYLWSTKQGDCKSYTVFGAAMLYHMGVDHIIRYVSYGSMDVRHVYPVAVLDGQEIPLDVVYKQQEGGQFGTEKPYSYKKDFTMKGLYKLGNTTNSIEAAKRQLILQEQSVQRATADIPESVVNEGPGDVTNMTSGELDRWLFADRYRIYAHQSNNPEERRQYDIAARLLEKGDIARKEDQIAPVLAAQVNQLSQKMALDTKPAFSQKNFDVIIPNPLQADVTGFFQDIGDFFKRIGKAIADGWKKLVNWIFKGVGKSMSPYFLYLYVDPNKVSSEEIKRRRNEQIKTFKWIAKTGKLEETKLLGVIVNGIKEKVGNTPKEIINFAAERDISVSGTLGSVIPAQGPGPGNPGFTPEEKKGILGKILEWVIKAIAWVIKAIKKIIDLFKKKDKEGDLGNPGKDNMSDPVLLQQEASSAGGGSSLLPLLLGGAAIFALR